MASEGNIIKITDVQTQGTQTFVNVFYYQMLDSADLVDIASAFTDDVINEVVKVQHWTVRHTAVILENLNSASEYLESQPGGVIAGLVDGEPLPTFVALSFKYQRGTRLTKSGGKRIGGLSESVVAGNVLSAGYTSQVADIEAALKNDLTSGLFPIASPVIYRPSVDMAPAIANTVAAVSFSSVSHQTSRKAG